MQIFYSLLQYIFLFVMLMIPGYIMGKRSRIDDQGTNTMTNLLTDIAMPFLVFSKLLQMDVSDLRLSAILCCLLLPSAVIIGVFLLTVLVFPAKEDRSRYPVNRFCSMMPNCGFIGIPLAAAIFPDRPEITLYISVVNVISTYILLTLGTFVLSENKGDIQPKKAAVPSGAGCYRTGAAGFPSVGSCCWFYRKLCGTAGTAGYTCVHAGTGIQAVASALR